MRMIYIRNMAFGDSKILFVTIFLGLLIWWPDNTHGTGVTSTLESQVLDMSKALNDFVNQNLGVDKLQVYLSSISFVRRFNSRGRALISVDWNHNTMIRQLRYHAFPTNIFFARIGTYRFFGISWFNYSIQILFYFQCYDHLK